MVVKPQSKVQHQGDVWQGQAIDQNQDFGFALHQFTPLGVKWFATCRGYGIKAGESTPAEGANLASVSRQVVEISAVKSWHGAEIVVCVAGACFLQKDTSAQARGHVPHEPESLVRSFYKPWLLEPPSATTIF